MQRDSNSELQHLHEPTDLDIYTLNTSPYFANLVIDNYHNTNTASIDSEPQLPPNPTPSRGPRQPNQIVAPNSPPTTTTYPQIGVVYCTGGPRKYLFECNYSNCGKTFQRSYELERHYTGLHAPDSEKEAFWCPKEGCSRNKATGHSPFPRKDKLRDHLRNYHRIDLRKR